MAIAQVTSGSRILISDLNAYYSLLKGAAGSGEAITLLYNAAGVIALQPSSDPAVSTQLVQVKNNAGTVKFAIRADGSIVFSDASIQTTAAISTAATVAAAGTMSAADKQQLTRQSLGNITGAVTADFTLGAAYEATMTGNVTFTFTAPAALGTAIVMQLKQDATGSRTVTWPAAVLWPGGTVPVLTTTAAKVDIFNFYWDGTSYRGQTGGLNYA